MPLIDRKDGLLPAFLAASLLRLPQGAIPLE